MALDWQNTLEINNSTDEAATQGEANEFNFRNLNREKKRKGKNDKISNFVA